MAGAPRPGCAETQLDFKGEMTSFAELVSVPCLRSSHHLPPCRERPEALILGAEPPPTYRRSLVVCWGHGKFFERFHPGGTLGPSSQAPGKGHTVVISGRGEDRKC